MFFLCFVTLLCAIVSFALRYCFPSLRDCFSHFTLLFPRFALLFPSLYAIVSPLCAIVSPILRYCFLALRDCSSHFALLFPRFTLWLCTLSYGCAYVSLFADRGSIDRIDRLKCTQRYFFFFNMTKIVPFLLIRRLSEPIVAARFADPLAETPSSHCTAAPSAPQTSLTSC